jgi:hypothetical protein
MTRRERLERKAERLNEWADKRDAKASAAYEQSREIAERIPFGQPILVGHHSERGHRADIGRIDGAMRRSRAENIERAAKNAIYSDDPDAVEQLTAKIARLEARRERIKAYNRTCKAGQEHGDLSILAEPEARDLLSTMRAVPYQCKNGRFPSYALTNLGGTIRTAQKRLAQLSAPERARTLTAKYRGECRSCGTATEPGDTIAYYRRSREVECASCAS